MPLDVLYLMYIKQASTEEQKMREFNLQSGDIVTIRHRDHPNGYVTNGNHAVVTQVYPGAFSVGEYTYFLDDPHLFVVNITTLRGKR